MRVKVKNSSRSLPSVMNHVGIKGEVGPVVLVSATGSLLLIVPMHYFSCGVSLAVRLWPAAYSCICLDPISPLKTNKKTF